MTSMHSRPSRNIYLVVFVFRDVIRLGTITEVFWLEKEREGGEGGQKRNRKM